MNDIAYEYYDSDTSIPPSQRPVDFPAQQLTIRHQGPNAITSIKETLVKMEMNANIEDYYKRKFAIHPDMMLQIEWTALKQHKMTKFIHRQYNTMCQVNKWNLAKTVTCPLCSTQKDDHNRFLQCPNTDIHRINETGMKTINNKMYAMKTTPALQKTLNYLLRNWHKTPENDKEWIASLHKDLQRCVRCQSIIGWDNFIRGIFYHGWRDYQHKECTITHKEYNEEHIRWI